MTKWGGYGWEISRKLVRFKILAFRGDLCYNVASRRNVKGKSFSNAASSFIAKIYKQEA